MVNTLLFVFSIDSLVLADCTNQNHVSRREFVEAAIFTIITSWDAFLTWIGILSQENGELSMFHLQ